MRFIILSLMIIFISCSISSKVIPQKSIWVTYELSTRVESNNNDFVEELALKKLIEQKLLGTKIIFDGDLVYLIYSDNGREVTKKSQLVKVTEDYFLINENGTTSKILYKLSEDKEQCDFTLLDGTILKTKKKI